MSLVDIFWVMVASQAWWLVPLLMSGMVIIVFGPFSEFITFLERRAQEGRRKEEMYATYPSLREIEKTLKKRK